MASSLLQVIYKERGYTFSPSVGFFLDKGKRYSRDLVESLVLSALTVSYRETSKRVGREASIKAGATTVWQQLKQAYRKYKRREKKTSSSSEVSCLPTPPG